MRRKLTVRERVAIFQRNDGVCHLCGMRVIAGQEWDVSHDTPIEMGGADEGDNLKIAHRRCHRTHTAKVDVPTIRKAQRREALHIGAKRAKRLIPGSKGTGLRKHIDGRVSRRTEES